MDFRCIIDVWQLQFHEFFLKVQIHFFVVCSLFVFNSEACAGFDLPTNQRQCHSYTSWSLIGRQIEADVRFLASQ